jgi:O-antigen chain-terminating methyltransferase
MNLRKTVDEIHGRVIGETIRRAESRGAGGALAPVHGEIARLGLSYQQLYSLRDIVGKMPPSPNSLRARIGGIFVRTVQRMLFWYTPQIHRFHGATVEMAEHFCEAMEKHLAVTQRLYAELEGVRSEMRVHGTQAAPLTDLLSGAPPGDPAFDHYIFALRNSAKSAPEERVLNVQKNLSVIESLTPALPAGPWLDIGCGDGDWLRAANSSGRDAIGVDDNLAALAHCRAQNLRVTEAEPLAFLRHAADSSYSLIGAFYTLNRYPARYAWELVREAVRALKPAGILILESSNPASLLAGSEDVWYDPTVLRPLPVFTARFLLEYFGLEMVIERALDSAPEGPEAPVAELEFVRRLNSHLYGPRAYAMIARRPAGIREPYRADSLETSA